jgi:tetratricopeptide (TPR) repeat protein
MLHGTAVTDTVPPFQRTLLVVGLALAVPFVLYETLLLSGTIPPLDQEQGGAVVEALILYAFAGGIVTIVGGFALAFCQQWLDARELARAKAQLETRIVELEAKADLDRQTIARFSIAYQDLAARAEEPGAAPAIKHAVVKAAAGDTAAARSIYAEIVSRKLKEGTEAIKEAAEAARNWGALAYLDDTQEAIEAYQKATQLDPADTWSWIFLGRLYQRAGNLTDAEQAFQNARDAAERVGNQRDVMVADNSLGDARVAKGDLAGAMAAYEAGLATATKLAMQDPSNAEWQRDLTVSFIKIGDVQRARGNLDAALKAYQDGLDIAEKLAARDPSNTQWQRDLSVGFERIGDVQRARGNLDAALKAYQEDLAIAEKLAAQDPSNMQWQYDVGLSLVRIGDVLIAQERLAEGLVSIERARGTFSILVGKDPSNTQWQYDLGISNERIGNMLAAQGKLGEALASYEERHRIISALAARDPSNAMWQRDLIVSNVKLAEVAEAQDGGASQAKRHYHAAHDIALALRDAGRLAPADAWMVDELEARLQRVSAQAAP